MCQLCSWEHVGRVGQKMANRDSQVKILQDHFVRTERGVYGAYQSPETACSEHSNLRELGRLHGGGIWTEFSWLEGVLTDFEPGRKEFEDIRIYQEIEDISAVFRECWVVKVSWSSGWVYVCFDVLGMYGKSYPIYLPDCRETFRCLLYVMLKSVPRVSCLLEKSTTTKLYLQPSFHFETGSYQIIQSGFELTP